MGTLKWSGYAQRVSRWRGPRVWPTHRHGTGPWSPLTLDRCSCVSVGIYAKHRLLT